MNQNLCHKFLLITYNMNNICVKIKTKNVNIYPKSPQLLTSIIAENTGVFDKF